MVKYGESLTATTDEDSCKKFFATIASFAKSFHNAIDDNIKRRLAAERKARIETENARRSSVLQAKRSSINLLANADKHGSNEHLDQEGSESPNTVENNTNTQNTVSFPTTVNTQTTSNSAREPLNCDKSLSAFPSAHNLFDRFHSQQEEEESSELQAEKFRNKLRTR